jgi:hypothetical protein
MNTISAISRSTPVSTGILSGLQAIARVLGHFVRKPTAGVPEASAALLRLAESYEATQPSYASDLRAAASSMSDSVGRPRPWPHPFI